MKIVNIFSKKNVAVLILSFIVITALFLRVYKLDTVPPALSWDETAVGYNAYSIANYGYDEWGNLLPLVFKSFEDDKNPVHIYFTALSVKILGLSDFSIRLPVAIFGTLNVLLIFFLAKELFNKKIVSIFAALFLAVSPYNLQFSRFNHEANFALFFFMLGLFCFLKGVKSKNYLIIISFASFGLSLLSYHSSKVVVPPIIILLIVLYFKQLWRMKILMVIAIITLSIFMSAFALNPSLLGGARIKQTSLPQNLIKNTSIYMTTKNETLGFLEIVGEQYMAHFSWNYLFISGDKNARHSIQSVGEFYIVDLILLIIGVLGLVISRSKAAIIVLSWVVLAPIPAALSGGGNEAPHAARALFMMGSMHLIAAYGLNFLLSLLKYLQLKYIALAIILLALGISFRSYILSYYNDYPKRYAIEWQYGYKQIGDFLRKNPNYSQVNITDVRHQPYIFILYSQQVLLPDFVNTVNFNNTESRSYNLVSSFNQYHFGDWDFIESMPNVGVLYILTPSQYDGLRHKLLFDVKELIKYPNGENAFFIITAK